VYENFELQTINELPHLLTMYPDLAGLNVTIPYKEEILSYLTAVTDTVKAIGACNCIRVEGGTLRGSIPMFLAFKIHWLQSCSHTTKEHWC
jgi:shikimate dehydrogenase